MVPLKSGLIDADRRQWSIQSVEELRELGRSRWLRLTCQHSSESYQDAIAPFSGRVPVEPAVPVESKSRLLLENGDYLLLENEDGSRLLLEDSS